MLGEMRTPLEVLARGALILLVINAACTSSLPTPPPSTPDPSLPLDWSGNVGPEGVTCSPNAFAVPPGEDIQSALNTAGAGGSLCVKSGVHRLTTALQVKSGQTLTFEQGAVLNGSILVTNWTKEGPYWAAGGQTQSFTVPSWMRETMCDNNPEACIYEDVFMDDKPLQHVTSLNKLRPDRVYFDKGADKIYIANDPQGRTMEVTVAGMAIQSEADGVTIRGATIEKFAYNGISTTADRWTISKSEIRHIHFEGIGIAEGTGHVIENNRVHHNGVIGMTVVDVSDFTVQGNEFAHNNYLETGPLYGHHEGSIKILKSHDVVFRDNWSHHNHGDGLWFDYDNYDILIENNLLESNTRNGLHYEASFDATVRYNTIRDNGTVEPQQGAGIFNSTSKNVDYHANRIANNAIRSIVILWDDRGRHEKFGERQSSNLSFRDNFIVLHNNFQSWLGVYWDQDPRVFSSNNRFEGNTYIAPKNPQRERGWWWRWDDKDLNWNQWRAYGFDSTGSYVRD
jgi:parallel beta-helix repeat protein